MKLDVNDPVLALAQGEVLTLDDVEGLHIQARAGTVWVTEEDDAHDYIIRAGDDLVVARPGRTVVQALAPAWISLRMGIAANDSTRSAA